MNTHQIDDGGPAFPQPLAYSPEGQANLARDYFSHADGMTLRDWFAGQALAGLVALPRPDSSVTSDTLLAYRLADAMLAARNSDIHQTADQLRRGIRGIIAKPDFTNPEEMVRRLDDLLSNTNTTAQ